MHIPTQLLTNYLLNQVYIAQLHRRAIILDSRFKDRVMEVFNFDASQSYRDSGGGLAQTSHSKALLSSAASLTSHSETSSSRSRHVAFMREGKVTHVEVFFANVKKPSRMREKLARYEPPYPGSRWPLTAHILDPVRLSVVCSGPSDIMQVSSRHSPLRPPFSLPLPL